MLKAPIQLTKAYQYLGSIYKTQTRNPQRNNDRVTKKTVIDRTNQISGEIRQRFYSANTSTHTGEILGATYIPTAVLRIKNEDLILYKKSSVKLYLDNRASSALIYRNQKPVFVDSVLDSNYDQDLNTEAAYFLKRSPGQVISLIRAAKKISQHLFFLEFAGLEKYQRSFVGYFDNGVVKFIGLRFDKIQLFENIDQLIEKVFGSKIKYREVLNGSPRQNKASYKTSEMPKFHDLFDFLKRNIKLKSNSALTVANLIAYMAERVLMTQCQRQILRYNLKTELGVNCDTVITDINYIVYHGLIIDNIQKTLTSLQFDMLFKNFSVDSINGEPKQPRRLENIGTEYFGQIVKFGRL